MHVASDLEVVKQDPEGVPQGPTNSQKGLMIEHILALALARSSTLRGRFLGFAPGMMDAIHTAKDSEQRATRMQL